MEEVGVKGAEQPNIDTKLEKFLRTYYHREILKVIESYPETRSLKINFNDLDKFDMSLADELLKNPDHVLANATKALNNIDLPSDYENVKMNIRFVNLPITTKIMIRDLRSEDVGKFITVEGIVRKSTDVRPKLGVGAFECQRCGALMHLDQEGRKIKQPFLCEGCETRGPFKLTVSESVFVDAQKILIQENLEDLRGGEHPKQLEIFLEDDLTGKITPGDRIEIIGILRAVTKRKEEYSRVFEIFLEGNSFRPVELEFEEVEITKEDEVKIVELSKDPLIFEKIKDSIAPHIYGYKEIKEAVMYQLFSSPAIELPDGGRIRGDSHIIIIGEPATGKSEILQYVAKNLAPRGIYVSGKGTSAAGLTAAAIKDEFGDGGWTIEAGALVLADNGIAAIDEFDKMEPNDRAGMHETMEQQTVSIAKAGIMATFRARCSILAAANPKYGRFDEYRSIPEQIDMPSTILSRFDLIFFVKDDPGETREVAKHIMDTVTSPESIASKIPPELMRKYLAYARQNCIPELTDDAREKVEQFYVDMRENARKSEGAPIPLTARQLWAVVRIARASSRVRLSNKTTIDDVDRAIKLVNFSLKQAGIDTETGKQDIDKIMVGVTKSQRDRLMHVLDIVRELEKELNAPVKKSEIIERAEKQGIPQKEVESAIERLMRDVYIYDPTGNERYKVV